MAINSNKKGDAAELTACAWLLTQGYDVFQNVSKSGPIDLVAAKPEQDEIRWIDVKNITRRKTKPSRTKRQIQLGVELLYVSDNGISFQFDEVSNKSLLV